MSKTNKSSLWAFIEKTGNYLIAGTLLCYVAGFAITNLYLGSLGIVNFDILRAKYILTGLLFILFLGAIAYLVYGLLHTIAKCQEQTVSYTFRKCLLHSLYGAVILYYAVAAISIFAGLSIKLPYDIPQSGASSLPWNAWFNQVPLAILKSFKIFIPTMVVIAVFVSVINPQDSTDVRTPWRQAITRICKEVWQKRSFVLRLIGGGVVILYVLLLLFNVLIFIITGKVEAAVTGPIPQVENGWVNFFVTIIIVYIIVCVIVSAIFILPLPFNVPKDDTTLSIISAWIYLLAFGILIIVPIYAYHVYPNLPQQVGGGQLLPVEISAPDIEAGMQFQDPKVEIYLVDRTSASMILLIANDEKQQRRIVEIPADVAQCITYSHSP